jgi:hypothetical protein
MTGRKFLNVRARRLLSWTGLAVALPALWACTTRSLEAPDLKPAVNNTFNFQESVNRDIDILFLIDNSSSMAKSQANLVRNFPTFMNVLKALPGGLPNVHIAVVSSDMGAGSVTNGCSGNGMAGIFQNSPKLTVGGNLCQTNLQNNARFIESINGNANFTGDISDVFTCIAALGEDGCGFEQQLLSVTHALGADNFDSNGNPQPPQENQGFLRNSAYLAIILITNEDDCSAPGGAGNGIFPVTTGDNLMSTLGPPTGYRCNRYGHVCDGAAPPKDSPMGVNDPGDLSTVVKLQNCTSAESTGPLNKDAQLIPVQAFADVIKALKPDPTNQILVAAIAGLYPDNSNNNPYSVTWKKSVSGDPNGPWPEMVHSCISSGDQSFADPGVRIGEWVKEFGRNGVLQSICDREFAPAMQRIAEEIGRVLGPKCVTGVFTDKDPNRPGMQYDCAVSDHLVDSTGATKPIDTIVPACDDNGGVHPCWHFDMDNNCRAPGGGAQSFKLTIDRDGAAPSGLSSTISCNLQVQP